MTLFKHGMLLLALTLMITACGSEDKQDPGTETVSESNNMMSGEMTDAQYVEQASFEDMSGNTVSVSDFEGKVVLIDFWETWCKPCLAIFPTMQKLQEEYPDDFVVLAVNPGFADTKEDAQNFIDEHDYDFKYLLDSNNLSEKLSVQSIPYKVYVDAEGNYIKSDIGSYGEDEDYKALKSIIEQHKIQSGGE
jgi:thiol-disulfide isomerase/thioredoxin